LRLAVSMILKLKRTPGIYLTGFMGSGKTTVGRALADELGWMFVDLDEEIEAREKRAIAEIFDAHGEAAFREMERAALTDRVRSVQMGRPQVIALGGGTLISEENFELVSNNGVSVWLDCAFAHVDRRIAGHKHRPLARDPEQFRALFETRRDVYARADYRIEIVDDDAASVVARILKLPLF
jgi:shikimate kinase